MTKTIIYHMCREDEWRAAEADGLYHGSSQDRSDGFLHFSTAEQIVDSAAKHRAGQQGLLLIAVEVERLGDALKWEESRGGVLFPHLHGTLPADAVVSAVPLNLGPDGKHIFPADLD